MRDAEKLVSRRSSNTGVFMFLDAVISIHSIQQSSRFVAAVPGSRISCLAHTAAPQSCGHACLADMTSSPWASILHSAIHPCSHGKAAA